jgi:hypothetical protein
VKHASRPTCVTRCMMGVRTAYLSLKWRGSSEADASLPVIEKIAVGGSGKRSNGKFHPGKRIQDSLSSGERQASRPTCVPRCKMRVTNSDGIGIEMLPFDVLNGDENCSQTNINDNASSYRSHSLRNLPRVFSPVSSAVPPRKDRRNQIEVRSRLKHKSGSIGRP